MARVCKSAKRYCSYCERERSITLFNKDPEGVICNFCYFFDRAAQITAPVSAIQ